MRISARVSNLRHRHVAHVATNDSSRELSIPATAEGLGSSVNGGELLCLALASRGVGPHRRFPIGRRDHRGMIPG